MSLRDKMLPNMKYSNAAENFEIASAEKKQKGSATKLLKTDPVGNREQERRWSL